MKFIIAMASVFYLNVGYSVPLNQGEYLKQVIPNQYIVKSSELNQKSMSDVKLIKKLGKNLALIETKEKNLKSYNIKYFRNYRYIGNFLELPIKSEVSSQTDKMSHHTMIDTLSAWNYSKGDKEIIVAVTDNEFQTNHVNLVNSWWKNTKEIPDNNIDDDENGYIDDVLGWDFIEGDNEVDASGEGTHGTHVSGTIAARVGSGLEGSGIAPNIKIMPLRWYDFDYDWSTAVVVETYQYAIDHGAKIISTSYNIDALASDEAYLDIVRQAVDRGILIFNSAGNGREENPQRQSVEEIVLVCSVQSGDDKSLWDKKSSFSNYGTGIDICAPGDFIYAPTQALMGGPQDNYSFMRGTSMATPIVAGVAALVWSINPNFTAEDVKKRLYNTAVDIKDINTEYTNMLGAGRVSAKDAVY